MLPKYNTKMYINTTCSSLHFKEWMCLILWNLPAKYATNAISSVVRNIRAIVAIFQEHLWAQVFWKWSLELLIAAEVNFEGDANGGLVGPGAVGGWMSWGFTQFAIGTIGPVVELGVLQYTGRGLLYVGPPGPVPPVLQVKGFPPLFWCGWQEGLLIPFPKDEFFISSDLGNCTCWGWLYILENRKNTYTWQKIRGLLVYS